MHNVERRERDHRKQFGTVQACLKQGTGVGGMREEIAGILGCFVKLSPVSRFIKILTTLPCISTVKVRTRVTFVTDVCVEFFKYTGKETSWEPLA